MKVDTTTRAYTVKLSGTENWRASIWMTHLTANKGVRAWGEWLLTLRGGLPAALADNQPGRRVILALSWLSVESPVGLITPQEIVVGKAGGNVPREEREEQLKTAFRRILKQKGVKNQVDWINDCEPALLARIRDDAVWVDRSAAFTRFASKWKSSPTPEWAADTLLDLLGGIDGYFAIPEVDAPPATEGKDFVIKAGNWLSRNWGAGEKSDSGTIGRTLAKLAQVENQKIVGAKGMTAISVLLESVGVDADSVSDPEKQLKRLKQAVGWKGRPSKGAMALEKLLNAPKVTSEIWESVQIKLREESDEQKNKSQNAAEIPGWMPAFRADIEKRIGMPFRIEKDNIWEFAVMLDHALRRVSAGHTWIKRAEASRRQFKEAASKIENLPATARKWLDTFCEDRSDSSGSTDGYTIRRGAIDGWDEVVKIWSTLPKPSRQARIQVVRDLQSNWPDDKKFGDVQLFAGFGDEDEEIPHRCLADDAAKCVWTDDKGKFTTTYLKDYVAARTAENDQSRFKVPAYRHPDPLRHPVFVDFGNSRWSITYSALKAAHDRDKLQEKLGSAKSDAARQAIQKELAEKPDLNGVTLSLWTGEVVEPLPLRWHGKRLRKDLDFEHFDGGGESVSRADRLGRAVVGQPRGGVEIAQVFGQSDWSGRLQAPRRELDRLADRVYGRKGEPDERLLDQLTGKALDQRNRLNWFLSFSAKLQPSGPWLEYAASKLPEGWEYKKGRTGYYLNIKANQDRKGRARLQLSRLHGLRLLSVDLGHRYAAACAVWETISAAEMEQACKLADKVIDDKQDDLFRHLKRKSDKRDKSGKPIVTTTIYRRIGPDVLPDGKRHPAPWARLDRQFLIKLQGEEYCVRQAYAEEYQAVNALYDWLGKKMEMLSREVLELNGGKTIYPQINEFLLSALRHARHGLRRYGDYARIAFSLTARVKLLSGGRSKEMTDAERVASLEDALVLWQGLANSSEHQDQFALQLWQKWIEQKLGGPTPVPIPEDASRAERKKKLDESRTALSSVASRLANRDNSDLHGIWSDEWKEQTSQWQQHLRSLRRIILPRVGQRPPSDSPKLPAWKERVKALRDVGGLSLDRLSTIQGLYKAMRAFHSRPEPHDPRAGVKRIEEESGKGYQFGERILQTLDRLRENRIKQLASRIVEAALGVGSENREHWERGRKRPRQRIEDARFAPCHAVVIENLENYRPEETRMRRENRQLMTWAARNVRKYIMDGCQLNGLYLDEVSAAYTSRQDSRTGRAGIRCVDVPADKLLETSGIWQKQIERSRKRQKDGKADERDTFLLSLVENFRGSSNTKAVLRIPNRGGDIFVSSLSADSRIGGLQADLNAAANIGLKALLDPDWSGAWWYVPCSSKGIPLPEKTKGSAVAEIDEPLLIPTQKWDAKSVLNLWRDLSEDFTKSAWMSYQDYWNVHVPKRVINALSKHNGIPEK